MAVHVHVLVPSVAVPRDPYALWALADSYTSLGRVALAAAQQPQRPPPSRREEAQAADAWLRKALAVWQEWPQWAATTGFDRSRREEAERELAASQRVLAAAR